jgi:hypothetical protein
MSLADDHASLTRSAAALHQGVSAQWKMGMVRVNSLLQTAIGKSERARKLVLRSASLVDHEYEDMVYKVAEAKENLVEAERVLRKLSPSHMG